MAVTREQIEKACESIERLLATFRADGQNLESVQRCVAGVQWLREQYRAERAVVAEFLGRLKNLSTQVHEALAVAREALTAKYIEASREASAWEHARETCRDALVELATSGDAARFDSPAGWVEVKRSGSISLPKAGTPERDRLALVLTEAGRWPDVAYPNSARLAKAVEEGLFNTEQAQEIARLCPAQTIFRLVCHGKE